MLQAREISADQANVLHTTAIDWLSTLKIPARLYSALFPHDAGTVIGVPAGSGRAAVRAVGMQRGIALWSLDAVEMCHTAGFLARAFACFDKYANEDLIYYARSPNSMFQGKNQH